MISAKSIPQRKWLRWGGWTGGTLKRQTVTDLHSEKAFEVEGVEKKRRRNLKHSAAELVMGI